MTSLRSKIIIGMIRNRHLFKGHLGPEVVDETFSVEAFRRSIDKSSERVKIPKTVRVEPISIAGMYAEWIVPQNPLKDKVLMYIHGGGFISGSCLTHRMHVAKFARECQMKSLLFDYRLAPEHPFPPAPQDCVTAYKWLLEQGIAALRLECSDEEAAESEAATARLAPGLIQSPGAVAAQLAALRRAAV